MRVRKSFRVFDFLQNHSYVIEIVFRYDNLKNKTERYKYINKLNALEK